MIISWTTDCLLSAVIIYTSCSKHFLVLRLKERDQNERWSTLVVTLAVLVRAQDRKFVWYVTSTCQGSSR